jgi:hypothetical protein
VPANRIFSEKLILNKPTLNILLNIGFDADDDSVSATVVIYKKLKLFFSKIKLP